MAGLIEANVSRTRSAHTNGQRRLMLRTGASSSVKTFHGKAFTATKGHGPDSFAIVVGGKLKIEKEIVRTIEKHFSG